MNELSFSVDQFGALFPYFICIDDNGTIESFGNYLPHLCSIIKGECFDIHFDIIRKSVDRTVKTHTIPLNEIVIIHSCSNPSIYFSGKFEKITNTNKNIFFGSPCYITGKEEIEQQFMLFRDDYNRNIFESGSGAYEQTKHFDNLQVVIRFFENEDNNHSLNDQSKSDEQYAITISDNEGKIVWCNSNFKELSGKSLAEITGKRPREIVYGKRSVFIDPNFVDNNVNKGKPFYFENIGYNKKGNEFWFGCTVHPVFDNKNNNIGRIHFIKDISYKKFKEIEEEEKETLLNLSLETSRSGAWSYDTISGEFQASLLFRKLTGIKTAGKITTREIAGFLNDGGSSEFPDDIALNTDPLNPSFEREYRILSDGKYRYFSIIGNCIKWTTEGKPEKLVGMLRDITETKEQSLELERQKAFYEQILNEIPADIVVFDKNHRYLYVNPKGIKDGQLRKWIIGKTDEEYCTYRNRSLVLAENRRKLFNETVASRRLLEWEEQLKNADGSIEYHLRKMSPVFNDHGDLEIVIGYGVNVTDSKRTEMLLRKSELRYKSIFDHSLALIFTHGLNGEILNVNNAFIKTMGYEHLNLPGMHIRNLLPEEKWHDFETKYLPEIKTKGVAEGIMKIKNTKGEDIYLFYQNYLLNDDTETPYVIGFSQNITERILAEKALKRSEEKYRNIIANMNLGLLEFDEQDRIKYANSTFCRMTGYEPGELTGNNLERILNYEEPGLATSVSLQNKEHNITDTYEIKVKTRNGETKWWLISGAAIMSNYGIYKGAIRIYLDITQKKSLEFELTTAKIQAEHSAQTKEIFLTNVSHEIRTPMNAIIGVGRLLGKTRLNEQQRIYLNIVQNAAGNLLSIINDLLDISKIESGKLTFEHIGFALSHLVRGAIETLNHKAEEKGLLLSYKVEGSIAPVLMGDPYRINQVLMNLLSNSIKFTEKGEVSVVCCMVSEDYNSQTIRFRVTDTGIGMKKEFLSQLFEKFSQEDESVTRKFGGTGLGMSITRQIVELMGATLNVESEKNVGTVISFEIKLPTGNIADLPEKWNSDVNDQVLKGKRILLAEDNEYNRFLSGTILAQYGAEVTEAENGLIAIEKLENARFDVVLMDVQMPVKDGLEATRFIRKYLDENIPIIALTANAFKKEEQRCLDAGMNDFVSKPFDELKLITLVSKWAGGNSPVIAPAPEAAIAAPAGKEKLYDLGNLRTISGGNETFIAKMIRIFIKTVPETLTQMKDAYNLGDWAKLSGLAHRIKPTIQSMEIKSIEKDLALIEEHDPALTDPSQTLIHLNLVIKVMNEIVEQLQQDPQ